MTRVARTGRAVYKSRTPLRSISDEFVRVQTVPAVIISMRPTGKTRAQLLLRATVSDSARVLAMNYLLKHDTVYHLSTK